MICKNCGTLIFIGDNVVITKKIGSWNIGDVGFVTDEFTSYLSIQDRGNKKKKIGTQRIKKTDVVCSSCNPKVKPKKVKKEEREVWLYTCDCKGVPKLQECVKVQDKGGSYFVYRYRCLSCGKKTRLYKSAKRARTAWNKGDFLK